MIYSQYCGVKNTSLTLYVNGLVVSTIISLGFQPLELKEGELVSLNYISDNATISFANWSK